METHILLLLLFLLVRGDEEEVGEGGGRRLVGVGGGEGGLGEGGAEDTCSCTAYTPKMKTVVVQHTMGNLGNKMFIYVTAHLLHTLFKVDSYITENVGSSLAQYFQGVGEVPVAERHLCGFASFHRKFRKRQDEHILSVIQGESGKRQSSSTFLSPKAGSSMVSLANSDAVYAASVDISPDIREHSSFPWQEFSKRQASELAREEEQEGKAYIFFPMGLPYNAFEDIFGEEHRYYLDNVPALLDFTLRAFTFRPEYRAAAASVLETAGRDFRSRKKIKGKTKELTYVGVHNRRGDHIDYQQEVKLSPLEPSYFLEAMEMYREQYKRVVFIYVSDDLAWARRRLLPRVKDKDLYLAPDISVEENVLAQGRDLAVLAACNHTIQSYGTYSFWGGFLAGGGSGNRIIPAHFPRYRRQYEVSWWFSQSPFENKMPRFYYGMT